MLKKGDSVMFNIGKESKVFTVSENPFVLEGTTLVTLDGVKGFIEVASLVKVQSLFNRESFQFEESIEAEFVNHPKDHHILDDEDKAILQEMKKHMGAGIEKLKERKLRGVNIEIELMQFIRQQLK